MRRVDVARLVVRLGIVATRDRDELRALCPNPGHDDRHPSWAINERSGLHACWSCGFSGNAADLVATVVGDRLAWDRSDGWEWIETHGLLLGEEDVALSAELVLSAPVHRKVLELPAMMRTGPLAGWPTPARRYVESRAITAAQVDRWGIGYVVDGRVRGRIVFPVQDGNDRLLSWTARDFAARELRYLTPSDEDGPDPGAIFGERHWGGSRELVVVCEGAIKALAVERAIEVPVAGMLGASRSKSPAQIAKLSDFAHVVVMTDSDLAGDRAWLELYYALARHVRSIERAQLPKGIALDDADVDVVRKVLRCA